MLESELLRIHKQLEKGIIENKPAIIHDLLEILLKWTATAELLKKTKLGLLINNLKKTTKHTDIRAKAQKCVDKWRLDLQASSASSASSNTASVSDAAMERSIKSDDISFSSKGEKVRDNCIGLLYAALAISSDLDGEIIVRKALSIEQKVFDTFQKVDDGYKSKIRSLQFNLKDKNNTKLRTRVLHGDINIDRFIKMTANELASEEKKQEIEEAKKLNMMDAQTAADQAAETDQFKCGKCKSRKCKYFQMQTRSADEPMTTFVTCINCDHRWRFC